MQWETRAKRLCIFASLLDGPKGYTAEGVESPTLPRSDDIITEICGAETLLKPGPESLFCSMPTVP